MRKLFSQAQAGRGTVESAGTAAVGLHKSRAERAERAQSEQHTSIAVSERGSCFQHIVRTVRRCALAEQPHIGADSACCEPGCTRACLAVHHCSALHAPLRAVSRQDLGIWVSARHATCTARQAAAAAARESLAVCLLSPFKSPSVDRQTCQTQISGGLPQAQLA